VRGGRAALPVLAAAVIVTGWATPGYSPWRDTLSGLEAPGQPYALVVRTSGSPWPPPGCGSTGWPAQP
jgi:hypothetical protein